MPGPDIISSTGSGDLAPTHQSVCRMLHRKQSWVRVLFDGRQRKTGGNLMWVMRWHTQKAGGSYGYDQYVDSM